MSNQESGERFTANAESVSGRTQWVQSLVAAGSVFVFAYAFAAIEAWIDGRALEPIAIGVGSPPSSLAVAGLVVGLLIVVVVPHELLHGVAMARFGASPRYGLGLRAFFHPVAYAECDGEFTRREVLVVLLAPFALLTGLGIAAIPVAHASAVPVEAVVVFLSVNAAGSVGDFHLAGRLLGGKPIRAGTTGSDGSLRPHVVRLLVGTTVTLSVLSLGIVLVVLGSLAFGSGSVGHTLGGGRWLLFEHAVDPAEGVATLEIGVPLVSALAIAGGVLWVAVGAVRNDDRNDGV